jgi:X-X-X-Leu-X-X-Gly heptad repeat protein
MLRLAQLSIRHPRRALAGWSVLVVLLALVGLGLFGTGIGDKHQLAHISVVDGSQSDRAAALSRREFGPRTLVPILLQGPRRQLNRQGPALAAALAARRDTIVISAWDAGSVGHGLRPNARSAMVVASVAHGETAMVQTYQSQIDRIIAQRISAPVRASVSGTPTLDRAIADSSLKAARESVLLAVPILALVILLLLRAPVVAVVFAAFGAATVLAGYGLLALGSHVQSLDGTGVALASLVALSLGLGLSTMIVIRFRREEGPQAPRYRAARAATETVRTTGRALLIGGAALALALILATFIGPAGRAEHTTQLLTSVGLGVLLCSMLAVGAAVVVMPAVLVLLGPRVEWGAFPAPRPVHWTWDRIVAGGGPVTRFALVTGFLATVALVLLALPLRNLKTGPPDPSQLPADNAARQDFNRISRVMGPGFLTPYKLIVVSNHGPLTERKYLVALDTFERRLRRDRGVAAVQGPGTLRAQTAGLKDVGKLAGGIHLAAAGGKKLSNGVGTAVSGSAQLNAGGVKLSKGASDAATGSGKLSSGAGQLSAGIGQAAGGAGQLSSGLSNKLQPGAQQLSGGLGQLNTGGGQLAAGVQSALSGATQLKNGVNKLLTPIQKNVPTLESMATNAMKGSNAVVAASGSAKSTSTSVDTALAQLQGMTSGKQDPNYSQVLSALQQAQSSAGTTSTTVNGALAPVATSALISKGFVDQLPAIVDGLGQLAAGNTKLAGGLGQLNTGAQKLSGGLSTASKGSQQLSAGVGTAASGAGQLSQGLSGQIAPGAVQLSAGAAQLFGGLSGQLAPGSQQLSAGITQLYAGLSGQLKPGAAQLAAGLLTLDRGIRQLKKSAPGLFDSGEFILAAIDGAPPAARNQAAFVLNIDRGGTAGEITVIPKLSTRSKQTQALHDTLDAQAKAFSSKSRLVTLVGGPAGELVDFQDAGEAKVVLAIVAIALAVFVLLAALLRAIGVAFVAVLFDLLTVGATLGIVTLLYTGDDPPLGGPGYLDPLSLLGLYAMLFGVTALLETVLLQRMRERYAMTRDRRRSLRFALRETASMTTIASVVMIAAAVPFMLSSVVPVQQFAIGLGVAVALNALIVRPVLLPAALQILGRWAWWPGARELGPRPAEPDRYPPGYRFHRGVRPEPATEDGRTERIEKPVLTGGPEEDEER